MTSTLTLDYSPFSYQLEYHDTATRFVAIAGGRRVGKSKMALMTMVRHCLVTEKATAWWVAPTLSTARDVGWNELKNIIESIDPIVQRVNETRMEVVFKNGSVMTFKGADNEGSLRGRGLTFLVMDEVAFIKEDIWVKVLRPALTDRQGQALLISTPNGKNWFYEVCSRAKRKDGKLWQFYHWPTTQNPLITKEDLEDAAKDMDELSFRQEFLAEFVTREGAVYNEFAADNIVAPGFPSVHDYDIYMGMDFGYANPTAICFMAHDTKRDVVYQFDEIYVSRMPMDGIEQMMINQLAKWNLSSWDVKNIYCDPAGNATDLSSGLSPVDFLRDSPMKWRVQSMGSHIMDGVNLVRSYMCNVRGQRRFFVTDNCKKSIESIERYSYAPKTSTTETVKEEPLKDGLYDHMCDAIRYFFVNHFDNARWVADTPEFFERTKKTIGSMVLKKCIGCQERFPSRTPKHSPPLKCRKCSGETYVD